MPLPLAESLTHLVPFLRWEGAEPLAGIANGLALFRGQSRIRWNRPHIRCFR